MKGNENEIFGQRRKLLLYLSVVRPSLDAGQKEHLLKLRVEG